MIKKILSYVFLIAVVIGGGIVADALRKSIATATHDAPPAKASSHESADDGHGKKKKKKKKKKGHGADDGPEEASATISYMKFKRQFVVPIINDGKIESLVLLNLNLELGPGAPDSVYTLEPKLRDAIMRALLTLSHEGVFSGDLTSAATYDRLSSALKTASESVISGGVKNVLILDLMRQDQ